MLGRQPLQYAAASPDAQRVSLVQTTEFNDLLTTTTEHGDMGIFTAPGTTFDRYPRLAPTSRRSRLASPNCRLAHSLQRDRLGQWASADDASASYRVNRARLHRCGTGP